MLFVSSHSNETRSVVKNTFLLNTEINASSEWCKIGVRLSKEEWSYTNALLRVTRLAE